MNKTQMYLVIVSCFAFGVSLAQAEPEACHDSMQGQIGGTFEEVMFKNMDANGDGTVSRAEFNAFNARRFKELDVNKDGKLTLNEMNGGQKKSAGDMRNNGTTHLDERFNAADANHDGGLDRQEAKQMPMLSMYFDEVDANHDGKVTRQEYFDAMPLLHRGKKMDAGTKSDSL